MSKVYKQNRFFFYLFLKYRGSLYKRTAIEEEQEARISDFFLQEGQLFLRRKTNITQAPGTGYLGGLHTAGEISCLGENVYTKTQNSSLHFGAPK